MARPGTASRPVTEVADRPLAECIAGFWSTSLSPARLRALPPAAAAPADLLLRSFEPPMLSVQGQDLVSLLRPAYQLMSGYQRSWGDSSEQPAGNESETSRGARNDSET